VSKGRRIGLRETGNATSFLRSDQAIHHSQVALGEVHCGFDPDVSNVTQFFLGDGLEIATNSLERAPPIAPTTVLSYVVCERTLSSPVCRDYVDDAHVVELARGVGVSAENQLFRYTTAHLAL
jgi:hypothetical protein